MTNFTKEELESILNWGEVYTEFGNSWVDKSERPLINKIQDMIDTYCEHQPSDSYYEQFRWQLCRKCGKEYQ
jgi:hypothetical protein